MSSDAAEPFSERVLNWFDEHGRTDMPWQQNISAYRVWVSEIMLQQTQVHTVIPYFEKFVGSFPNVLSLANAAQDEVLAHWSGLGYYARARNLHKAAQQIRDDFDGVFPIVFDDVIGLPGIGRSTAGAILSIAGAQRHAILDGNVKRVLARHEMIAGWPGKTATAAKLWRVAEQNTPSERVANYTQAIMDLGATLCRRSKPSCSLCPVSEDCAAFRQGCVADYPGRKRKVVKPLRSTVMLLVEREGEVYLQRRPELGIWGGLWSLPELGDASIDDWCATVLNCTVSDLEIWDVLRHSFSHFDLDIQPIVVRVKAARGRVADAADVAWHKLDGKPPGGLAAPIKQLIEQLKKSEDVAYR